jgi:hypothetical protein
MYTSDLTAALERLVRSGGPYLHYIRQDHDVEDACEVAGLRAGSRLGAF